MGNTFSQVYLHIVFGVKFREALIRPHWKNELCKYITAIVRNEGHRLLSINGTEDHLHILIGFVPKGSISELVKQIKGYSSKWINENRFCPRRFRWQEGYGVFSYNQSHISRIINYIENQETHHAKRSFREEFVGFLDLYRIEYQENYLPDNI